MSIESLSKELKRGTGVDTMLRTCDAALERFGDTAEGALWPNQADRLKRFEVMLGVMGTDVDKPRVVCDFACGTGELLTYLKARSDRNVRYVGVDRSARALSFARAKHPEATFLEMDVNAEAAPLAEISCDYLVCNGLFTAKWEMTQNEMWSFLESTIRRVWPQVRRGIAFNVMSKVVDWERDDLFHVPMDDVARLLHSLAGRRVVLRADYGLYEYTAYAYRDSL